MNGVPDTIVYQEKPRATSASKVRQNFLPINGREFGPSSQIHFSIACGRKGAFLDPRATFLKFRLHNKDTSRTFKLDHSAHSAISVLECFYGSTQLEHVREYSGLMTALLDCQATADRHYYNGSILEGSTGTVRVGREISASSSHVFCIPLLSGVLGTLGEKFLPVGSMTRENLRLSLTLADIADIQNSTVATADAQLDWYLSDVELVTEYVFISPEVARTIESMSPQGVRVPMTSFSVQSNNVPTGVNSINLLLSGNFRSVKTLLSVFRKDSNRGGKGKKYASSRVNPIGNDGSYQFDIAGFKVPQQKVVGQVEAFKELEKAFHSYSSAEGHGVHDDDSWEAAEGSFLIGQDLDHFGGKSSVAESGVDISTSTCYLQANFPAQTTESLRCDTWFHYDAVLVVSPDGAAAQTLV